MNPTQGPVPGQISQNWGDPQKVQEFRNALIPSIGAKAADDYVNQYMSAYQEQQKNAIGNTVGQTQGALTPDQAQANPVAASQFIGNGGKIIDTGPGAQAQFINQAQQQLKEAKGKNKYVDPTTYNDLLGKFVATGGNEADFNSKFNQYTDPNKIINYNTPEGRANQQAYGQIQRQIQGRLDQYNQIPSAQKGVFSVAQAENIPVIGQLIAPHAYTYDQSKQGFAAQLKGIAGGGPGSGLRVNDSELEKWANLIPSATDSQTVAHDKLNQLNTAIKSTFNTSTGLDTHYLPSNGRPPLANIFGQ